MPVMNSDSRFLKVNKVLNQIHCHTKISHYYSFSLVISKGYEINLTLKSEKVCVHTHVHEYLHMCVLNHVIQNKADDA